MPELDGKARDESQYVKRYTQETYDEYSDKASGTVHGRTRPVPPMIPPPFSHRPDHDIESIFWVLLFTLILALPQGSYEKPLPNFYEGLAMIRDHTIDKNKKVDVRDWFFHLLPEEWSELFHPKLSPLVPMMEALAEQVYPEYGLLCPPPNEDHLHEAFRRILLKQILSMKDNIPLMPGILHNPDPKASIPTLTLTHYTQPQPTSEPVAAKVASVPKKRKADEQPSSTRVKSLRCVGGVRSSSLHDHYHNA